MKSYQISNCIATIPFHVRRPVDCSSVILFQLSPCTSCSKNAFKKVTSSKHSQKHVFFQESVHIVVVPLSFLVSWPLVHFLAITSLPELMRPSLHLWEAMNCGSHSSKRTELFSAASDFEPKKQNKTATVCVSKRFLSDDLACNFAKKLLPVLKEICDLSWEPH